MGLVRSMLKCFVPRSVRRRIKRGLSGLVDGAPCRAFLRRADRALQLLDQRLGRIEAEVRRRGGLPDRRVDDGPEADPRPREAERPRLAVFAPLPPSRSGIADYAAELAPWLSRHFDLVHVIDDSAPEPEGLPADVETLRLSTYLRQEERDRRTPRLYHVGNNRHHAFVFRQILKRPGVTVLHDFVLHHLVSWMTVGQGDMDALEEFLAGEYGALGRQLAERRRLAICTDVEHTLFPLNGPVLKNSWGVVAHSFQVSRDIETRYPGLPVRRIPHHLGPWPPGFVPDSRREARRRLGLDEDKFVVASFGFITAAKQIDLCLRALAEIRDGLPPFVYLLVGEQSEHHDVRRHIHDSGLQDLVRTTGYVDLASFHDHMLACDVAINLRYPTAGETSGTLVRALGLGRPAIVFDHGSFGEYPDQVVVKIPLDTQSTRALERAILTLAKDPALRERIGRAAADHVRAEHDIRRNAGWYARFIREVLARNRGSPHAGRGPG